MSMDLAVWSPVAISLPDVLPSRAEWVETASELALEGEGWQILALIGDDSPPHEVLQKLPGAKVVVYVTLEPIGAPESAYERLEEVVRHVARVTNGVWIAANGEPNRHDEGSF